jgi:gamma-glutamyltranspeptidase/glutathione hydrolase
MLALALGSLTGVSFGASPWAKPGFDRWVRLSQSTRSMVVARRGIVSTSQPLAAEAGVSTLRAGGNAFDAAIATAAVLNVVEPMSTGVGGDVFVLGHDAKSKTLFGLNGSGRSSRHATLEHYRRDGRTHIASDHIDSVTVPGAVDAWYSLHQKYGRLEWKKVLAPAIYYAKEGFPVSEVIADAWAITSAGNENLPGFAENYLPNGRPPKLGEVFHQPALAETLTAVANHGRDGFYRGKVGEKITAFFKKHGSLIDAKDLADHTSTWVQPVKTTFMGYEFYELPPNGQGIAAIEILNILEGFDLKSMGHNSAAYLHHLIEAKKLAWTDRDTFIADPEKANVPTETLISKEYAAKMREQIDPKKASKTMKSLLAEKGDTVYLSVVDGEGNACSFINSVFHAFGSGHVVNGTGICLQNRGALFSLEADHLNVIAPSKRPFHTIIPAMLTKNGKPIYCFGVMGGDMQPQGHVQVLLNILVFGMNVQEAGEAARFRHMERGVALEHGVMQEVRSKLEAMGHTLIDDPGSFGGYQGIWIDPETGVLYGGSDNRSDGAAIGF